MRSADALAAPGAGVAVPQSGPGPDEMAAWLRLAAEEYALGVGPDGAVTIPAEVEEARLFLAQVREGLPALRARGLESRWAALAAALDSAVAVVEVGGPPEALRRAVESAVAHLVEGWGARLVAWPARDPLPGSGRALYGAHCAACHGPSGRGDGALARGLDPAPPDLTDRALAATPPDQTFRVVTYGIPGTAMPAFGDRLSVEERWDVVAYVRSLAGDSVSTLAYVRGRGVRFPEIASLVASSVRKAAAGRSREAERDAIAAYLEFERVEAVLRAREPELVAALERDFLALRGAVAGRPESAAAIADRIHRDLERAERALAAGAPGRWGAAVESWTIIVREGFEAMLIVGALLTFLTRTGHREGRRWLLAGVGWAVAASLVTAVAVEVIFRSRVAPREALEGVTMLLATAVLFSVSYWLASKIEHAAWNRYVTGKVRSALARGGGWALAAAGFLAVYREGFETVLFYKALLGAGRAPDAVAAGFVAGLAALAVLGLLFYRFGVRLPLRPFFAVTSAVLYYMAFVFAGKGVHALQEAGWVSATWIEGAPLWDAVGVYPTVESCAAQGLLVVALLGAVLWVFALRPLRWREPAAAAGPSGGEGSGAR